MTNLQMGAMTTADMIVVALIPEAPLAIKNIIKTGIISLLLKTARIIITMWRNLDNNAHAHVLQVETLNLRIFP